MSNLVSNSEADSFLSCQQKHFYSFGEPNSDGGHGITPREHSENLTRGIIGHAGLEEYWTARMVGSTHDDAVKRAIIEVLNFDTDLVEVKSQVVRILGTYFEFYRDDFDLWKPLAIEREFRVEINGAVFPFKPDAILQNRKTGEVVIVDHKFVYNYYQDRIYPLMPQLKKYTIWLRLLGFRVDGYMYNMISTRANSKQPFKRTEIFRTGPSAQKFSDEHENTAKKIIALKALPTEEWRASIQRNASSFSCSHCPFVDLCTTDLERLNGRKVLISNFYQPNSYRYEEEGTE